MSDIGHLERLATVLRRHAPSASETLVAEAAFNIDVAISEMVRSERGAVLVRVSGKGKDKRPQFSAARKSGAVARSIKRMMAAAHKSSITWQKSWQEAPREAIALIEYVVGGPEALGNLPTICTPGFFPIPHPEAVAPFFPKALQIAGAHIGRPPRIERDRAVITILREHSRITGDRLYEPSSGQLFTQSPPFVRLIASIEELYEGHVEGWGNSFGDGNSKGFGVLNSASTLCRLIRDAKT